MKTIFVVLAPSRSGKDTLAGLIELNLKADMDRLPVQLKWSGHVKRVVECTYGLPKGSLEDPNVRNAIIPGTSKTYLDLLVSFYHTQDQQADPYFWKRPVFRQLEDAMISELPIISTDTRDAFEVEAILDLKAKYDYQMITIKLDREGNPGLSSDKLLERNFEVLGCRSNIFLEFTVKDDPDNFRSNLLPVCDIAYKLAQDIDKDRSETVHF